MSTLDIWEEEERQKRLWAYRRKQQYQRIANALHNLLEKQTAIEESDQPHDIEQGGHDE